MTDTKTEIPPMRFVSFRQIYDPIEKIRHFELKYANKRKTSIERFFSIYSKPSFELERKQEARVLRCFSLAFDNPKIRFNKRRFKINLSNKQNTSTNRRFFFLYKLNQKLFLH